MIGLFDADILVFRCGFACERTGYHLMWDKQDDEWTKAEYFEAKKEAMERLEEVVPGKYSREEGKDFILWPEVQLEPLGHALQNVKTLVRKICEKLELSEFDVQMYLSPYKEETFRKRIGVTRLYKGNRSSDHRPTYEKEIREYIQKTWSTTVAHDEEADDLIGIAATQLGDDGIIITIDKDLDTIAGRHYNWVKEEDYIVTQAEADHNLAVQILSGDPTDNIPGLPKIGPGRAKQALHGLKEYDDLMLEVAHQYASKSPEEDWFEYMLEQARLVYIRRRPGELWEPPECVRQLVSWESMGEEDLTL